jgi:thiol-disulfide isomerase/thioredoxin
MKTNTIFALIIVVIVAVGGFFIYRSTSGPGPYDEFAQCLKDNGVKFYGAFWCPHCQAQKKLFKKSAKKLPYIECSTANGSSQLPVCTDVGIQSYPTWEFADGTRKTGEQSFAELAAASSCPLQANMGVGTTDDTVVQDSATTITQ